MGSPTTRSLAEMRKRGFTAAVSEKWVAQIKQRKDLFGFADIVALGEREVIFVQATSASNVSVRVRKIAEHENVGAVRRAGVRILVHGWKKNKAGRWEVREVDCS